MKWNVHTVLAQIQKGLTRISPVSQGHPLQMEPGGKAGKTSKRKRSLTKKELTPDQAQKKESKLRKSYGNGKKLNPKIGDEIVRYTWQDKDNTETNLVVERKFKDSDIPPDKDEFLLNNAENTVEQYSEIEWEKVIENPTIHRTLDFGTKGNM